MKDRHRFTPIHDARVEITSSQPEPVERIRRRLNEAARLLEVAVYAGDPSTVIRAIRADLDMLEHLHEQGALVPPTRFITGITQPDIMTTEG